jgi:Arc/MetJ family transcription regulator
MGRERKGPGMAKTLIDLDEEQLAAAQEVLHTATKRDTVNAALRHVVALAARRRDLQRLSSGGLPDLADEEVMRGAWRR